MREKSSDSELVEAHLAGDSEAFTLIVRRYQDKLWSVARYTTGNDDDAADAVQNAFLAALKRLHTFRGDAALSTWLHRITVNACLDILRKYQRKRTDSLDDLGTYELPVLRSDVERVPEALTLTAALTHLTEEYRAAVVLTDVCGYSVAEVAEILNIAPGTVKSRCSRARSALRELLAPKDGNHTETENVQEKRPKNVSERSSTRRAS